MGVRKTNSKFVKEIEQLVGEEYVFLEEYTINKTPTLCRHNACGHEWKVAPRDFLSGNRCPMCSRNRMTNKQFSKRVFEMVGDEYIFLEEYTSVNRKIQCMHNIGSCRHKYSVYPSHFLSGTRCPSCLRKNRRKTDEEFRAEVYELVGSEYNFLDRYVGASKKIRVKHNDSYCGYHEYEVAPNKFLCGRRCPKCASKKSGADRTKTQEQFKDEVFALTRDEYTFLEPYKTYLKSIKVVHNECGFVYKTTPSRFISSGNRCPMCKSMSNGEVKVTHTLESFGVGFVTQYREPECRYIRPLPFDFAIFRPNGDLALLIEYDGQQHFESGKNSFGHTDEDYREVIIRDEIKNRYCQDNNIKLLRIPYWEFENIEPILFDVLVESGEIEDITPLIIESNVTAMGG